MTLEQKIEGYCPGCGEKTTFEFIGLQGVYKSDRTYKLYNCVACSDTQSAQSIKEYTQKIEKRKI